MQWPSRNARLALHRRARETAFLSLWLLTLGCQRVPASGKTPARTSIITGSTGSTWYTIGSALAEKANLFFDGHPITAVPGAGGVSNPVRASMTGVDVGISYGPFLRAAYRGEAPFREALPQLRVVATLVLNTLHVLANPELPLESVADLDRVPRGTRFASGPPGSGDLFCLSVILEDLGTTLPAWQDRGVALRLSGSGQRFEDWKDGRLEVAMVFINDPSPQLTETLLTRPGRFLPVPAAMRARLVDRFGFRSVSVPPGAYPSLHDEVETVALPSILFALDTVDESIVHALTRALYENQDYLRNVHPGFERWSPTDLPKDVGIPFHQGALRYYREHGLVDAEPAPGT